MPRSSRLVRHVLVWRFIITIIILSQFYLRQKRFCTSSHSLIPKLIYWLAVVILSAIMGHYLRYCHSSEVYCCVIGLAWWSTEQAMAGKDRHDRRVTLQLSST